MDYIVKEANIGNYEDDLDVEISFSDMLWSWISHWRSFVVLLVIGLIISVVIIIKNGSESSLTSTLSTNGFESYLEEGLRVPVEDLVESYKAYCGLIEEYNSDSVMNPNDKAAMYKDIMQVYSQIEATKKSYFSEEQKEYFNYLLYGEESLNTQESKESKFKKFPWGLLIVFLHPIACCGAYVFNGRIKPTDNISNILQCGNMQPCINWNLVNSRNKIDKAIIKARYSHNKKIPLEEIERINATTIKDIVAAKDIKSIIIIHGGLNVDGLCEKIKGFQDAPSIKCVDSVIYNSEGANTASGVDGAIVVVEANITKLDDLIKEKVALESRNIPTLAVGMYIDA